MRLGDQVKRAAPSPELLEAVMKIKKITVKKHESSFELEIGFKLAQLEILPTANT